MPSAKAFAYEAGQLTEPNVVISEVMWMGSDVSTADEWVELAAFSDDTSEPASLSGWTLVSVKDGAEQIIVRFASGAFIASGGFAVIGNYPETQSRLLAAPFATSTSMSLPNTKLLLRLYDGRHMLRDEVDDGVGNPFAGTNTSAAKASMERIDVRAPGNIASNWRSATVSTGFDATTFALFGTPGSGFSTSVSSSSVSVASMSGSSVSSVLSSVVSSAESSVSSAHSPSPFPPPLRINEVMPNPLGSDDAEWIEIINMGSGSVSTAGITVSMSGSTTRALPLVDLLPGIPRLVPKNESKLSLTNAGGVVVLKQGDIVLDFLVYPMLPEGVSFGRGSDGILRSLCDPTPGAPNSSSGSVFAIDVQSGMPTGESVTLNLALRSVSGSMDGAVCRWEYPDGYVSETCNPPSHALQSFGAGDITLSFTDYCGNTMVQSLPVFVTKKPKKIEEESTNSILPFSCMPSAFTGALITEVLPNPDGDEEQGEWIEMRNVSGRDLPLCGWSIEDASGKRFDLRRLRLPLDEIMLFPRTRTDIALNNDKDSVRLIAPDPLGGSGIVLQEVTFDYAPAMQSYALRDDGRWLWSPLMTPGLPNAFPSVPLPSGPPKARLRAVLPNPHGVDGASEWVEVENLTGRPLWLQKWMLRSGKAVPLDGKAIHPYATERLMAGDLGLTLRNATGSIRLFDDTGVEVDFLSWNKPKDGEVVMHEEYGHRLAVDVIEASSSGVLSLRVQEKYLSDYHPSGIQIITNKYCLDLISALTINKKLELLFNTEIRDSMMLSDGYDIAPFLLKNGCAYASHETERGYAIHEEEGFRNRRGLWASDEIALAVRETQRREDLMRVVRNDGIDIHPSVTDDLVQSGAVLTFRSSLPVSFYASLNGSPYRLMQTGAVIASDTVVQAYAELRIGSGTLLRSDIFEKEYVLLRSEYAVQRLLSEAYPSPRKGESEWIELYNGSQETLNLAGWTIDDASGSGSRPFSFTSDYRLPPHSFLALKSLKVSWNNGGDEVRLIAPDGTVVDSIAYPKIKTGFGYARTEDGWCLTEKPTSSSANICYLSPSQSKVRNSRSALSKNKKSMKQIRKILYKNIVHIGDGESGLPPFFEELMDAHLGIVKDVAPLRGYLYMLLAFYCACIACFGVLRRY